jgi:spore maturation protein CgeB
MKLVVFGLTVSSSWGNGHATLWRGLIRALERRGHEVVFFERDVPYYAEHRDLTDLGEAGLVLYPDWDSVRLKALGHLLDADVAMVTSYCPDARPAADLIAEQGHVSVFYDLDTPVTLARLAAGESVPYLPEDGLGRFDLVLSYTGGQALERLKSDLGARRTAPLYGHVDPEQHHPHPADPRYSCDLSYLGTYAADRQATLERLFIDPARRRPQCKFVLGGSGYPQDFPWTDNVWFVQHLPPVEHAPFFSSSRLTLNVTRADMAAMGWCPSGRLFEAAACGAAILSDRWEGLETFFTPGSEILLAGSSADTLAALDRPDADLKAIGRAARERVLDEHTSDHRAEQLLGYLADLSEGELPSSLSASASLTQAGA